jgi:death-on-curing protein
LANEPAWLSAKDVIEINRKASAAAGEPHELFSIALLESACKRPRDCWYYNDENHIVALAAQLLIAIAQVHCFEAANEQTAFLASVMFLELNGYELIIQDTERLGRLVEQLIVDEVPQDSFVRLVTPFLRETGDGGQTAADKAG